MDVEKIIIYSIVIVCIFAFSFFLGQCSSSDSKRENIELKNSLDESRKEIGRFEETIRGLESTAGRIQDLESENSRLESEKRQLESRLTEVHSQLKDRDNELKRIYSEIKTGNTDAIRIVGEMEQILFER